MSLGEKSLVYTNENCVGCNKCINVCSCIGACVSTATDEKGHSRINVDPNRCVACGACFDACEHGAREYHDDTVDFFEALKNGEKISVLIAPAFRANYPDQYESVLGALKAMGVNRFINVSFGADITTWGYVKLIREYGFKGGISQPCPAVVTYIEKYLPQLIPMLFPVQSPLMCAATYARKEMGITDKFAFISPCIAKKMEIDDPVNKGLVSYNVTFNHLMKYLAKNKITGNKCSDEVEYGLGSIYPMPGGLKDYVCWLLGDRAFIRQIEGEKRMYNYLRENASSIADKKVPFLFIDALNCEKGCLCGTATDPELSATDKAYFNLLNIRENIKKDQSDDSLSRASSPEERLKALNRQFAKLNLKDYLRTYTDRSAQCAVHIPNEVQLDRVFRDMRKDTPESRQINCTSCGYNTCREMAAAIFNGFNHRENCVHYLKSTVEMEQERIKYQAEHDEALDIWNRRYAENNLPRILKKLDKYAVIMADIDGFKGINETYGHEIADNILKQVAAEFKRREKDEGWFVARYGGDEFLLMVPGETLHEKHPSVKAIMNIFTKPISIGGNTLKLSVSVGISNADELSEPGEHIVNAENAMYEAKSRGRNRVFIYVDELKEKAREESRIKDKVAEALDNNGFFMVYQPKVNTQTKKVCGYEALIRMKTPGVYPGQFIPIAEKNGWIWRIGRITTELVIRQIAEWKEKGHPLYPVSINFSSNQLSDTGYVDFLENLLREYGIPPQLVEIEITEGVFLDKTAQANELFQSFKNLGIRLLMDDFGTGYSSLGYLTYIPVDVIKLDKSLVDAYLVEGKDSFINDVIRLVHDLEKEMTVEGVEEAWQYERLKEFGADVIQGYFFSKPLPANEAIEFKVS